MNAVNGPCLPAIVALALFASGCATTDYAHRTEDNRINASVQQPFRDLSIMREHPPEVLIRAAAAPYALDGGVECGALVEEIAALDLVLGPDIDAPDRKSGSGDDAASLLAGAIEGVIGLPYRGVVRRVSGADRRDRELREAILAGMVRRGFLKGVAHASDCIPD